MLSRKERKNMIEFIKKVKSFEAFELMYMTDEDIEHIYESAYYHHEEVVE